MKPTDSVRAPSWAVRLLWILVAITTILSLLYGLQYYLGGGATRSRLRLPVVSEFHSMALSPNEKVAAAGAADGKVRLWEIPSRFRTAVTRGFDVAKEEPWRRYNLTGYGGPVLEIAFAPDSTALISADQTGRVLVWDVASLTMGRPGSIQLSQDMSLGGGPLVDVAVSADSSTLATIAADGRIQVWDLATEEKIREVDPSGSARLVVALSPDGSRVAAGDGVNIQVWNVVNGEPTVTLQGVCQDRLLASLEACSNADKDWTGHDEEVTALAFSPDGQLLASGSADTTVIFWDLETGEPKWASVGHWSTVTAMVFSQDGETLLTGGRDYKSRTIRVVGGKSTAIFEGHLSTIDGVALGPGPGAILTAGEDGTLRLWETANQYLVHLEWSRLGFQPVWGSVLAAWMLASGVLALVSLWGLSRMRIWGHLLALALFLLGPIVVLGLPLFEVLTYPLQLSTKLEIAWPLLALLAWYVVVYVVLTRESVALRYETLPSARLSDQLMVSQRTMGLRKGIYGVAVWISLLVILYSVLRRFNLDIAFMGSFLRFIMLGSGITFYVSALSIGLAVILALLGALGRLSKNPIASGVSGFYISLIRGTPLLVQIYIWYLGLPRLDVVLPATLAGILALGVNYGAYMTEIFRAGIQAVSKGQHEAAHALGMSAGQTFRRIVLPQAFRIVIPPIGNEFIAMMKDSSLVSVMAVQELTWRANKIGRQYFRGMETFIIAAAFYWILTVVFQMLQGRLEEHMARGERR